MLLSYVLNTLKVNAHLNKIWVIMKNINDVRLFIKVVDLGSISATARQLDMTSAGVSTAIKRLEEEVGTQLLVRSTRSIRLTTDGEFFYDKSLKAIEILDSAIDALKDHQNYSGSINVSAPSDFGRNILLNWINEFTDKHPKIKINLFVTDAQINLISNPVDLAIRYGTLPDSELRASVVTHNNYRVLVASPKYLSEFGEPSRPKDLLKHSCLTFIINEKVFSNWCFHNREQVTVDCNRTANDGDVIKKWTMQGYGISYRSLLDVYPEIMENKLKIVGKNWGFESLPLHFVFTTNPKYINPIAIEFRTFIKDKINSVLSNSDLNALFSD
ncbi:TPA: LysR family transcriptional regulator [Photobacterium damselae]